MTSLTRTLLVLAIAGASTSALAADLPTDAIFSKDSFWYTPIPAQVPLNPKSAEYVADFQRQKKAYYGTVSINLEGGASPVYVVAKDVPTVRVARQCGGGAPPNPALEQQWAAVPLPAFAVPAKGSDSELTVYQPSTDTMWEFWMMRHESQGWVACWGGMMSSVSKSSGIWPDHYGTTATSLPFLGGQITADELKRGEIRHVMGIALVDLEKASIFSWPATRSDGKNPENLPNRIPEGLRFRLDPTVDVDSLNMHPVGKTIAKAAQKYGFVVWDYAGAITLRGQNPLADTAAGKPNPYQSLFAGTLPYAILAGFPWDRLQFLPMDFGKPR